MIEVATAENHPGVAAVKVMIDKCDEQLAAGRDFVVLVIGERTVHGERIRLTPVGGPLGEVMCVNVDKQVVARFPASKVAKFLRKAASDVGVIL
jgi:hypothetical protein